MGCCVRFFDFQYERVVIEEIGLEALMNKILDQIVSRHTRMKLALYSGVSYAGESLNG